MRNLKHLFLSGLAVAFMFGFATTQAKEWEQSYIVNLRESVNGYRGVVWGFSKDGIVGDYGKGYSIWETSTSCVCGIDMGSCFYELKNYDFFEFDQKFWNVVSKEGLKEGSPLDLNDTSAFNDASSHKAYSLTDSYQYSIKGSTENDTTYFVYKKDSSYYALCQYITVYDTVYGYVKTGMGFPAFFVHQCVFQDSGSPTFSKIPSYTGVLPESERVVPSSRLVKTPRNRNNAKAAAKYLVNGRSANGISANGVRVEKERIYRPSVSR